MAMTTALHSFPRDSLAPIDAEASFRNVGPVLALPTGGLDCEDEAELNQLKRAVDLNDHLRRGRAGSLGVKTNRLFTQPPQHCLKFWSDIWCMALTPSCTRTAVTGAA
jgi:hypothetical protein